MLTKKRLNVKNSLPVNVSSEIVMNTALDIQQGSYDHLELLEQSYKQGQENA